MDSAYFADPSAERALGGYRLRRTKAANPSFSTMSAMSSMLSNEIVAIPALLDTLSIGTPSSPSTTWDVSAKSPGRSPTGKPTTSSPAGGSGRAARRRRILVSERPPAEDAPRCGGIRRPRDRRQQKCCGARPIAGKSPKRIVRRSTNGFRLQQIWLLGDLGHPNPVSVGLPDILSFDASVFVVLFRVVSKMARHSG